MEPESRILASGTMRTGGSLLSNLMCAHSKMFVFGERFHFFRFCHDRYDPLTEKSVHRLLHHQRLRLRYRFEIEFNADEVFERVLSRGLSYAVIYDEGMKYFLRRVNRVIWGEYVAMQWRDIPTFIGMYDNARAIQVYRDPRSVLSSWKRLTFAPDGQYLNPIFNWIDSMNQLKRFTADLPSGKYLPLRYETLMSDPETCTHRICDFIGLDFEENMLRPETWHGLIPAELLINPRSAHEGENIRGFSVSRTNNWTKNLEEWEIALVEHLCGDLMESHGYEFHGKAYPTSVLRRGLDALRQQPMMAQRLDHFLSTGEGTPLYHNDPTDPRNWAAARRDIAARFTDAEADDAGHYFKELDAVEAMLAEKHGEG